MRPVTEQTVVITGATSGLGRELAGALARLGARLVVHGRDPGKLESLRKELADGNGDDDDRVVTVQADLADLRQVDRLADELTDRLDRIDVLVSNAGVGFGPPGAGREVSAQGVELRFAVNYLAGYHLTRRLLPRLVGSAPSRIVNVASIGQAALDFDDLLTTRDYEGIVAYRRSKLAQVMSTFDLADELAGEGVDVTVNALHPATFMDTAMVRETGGRPLSTVAEGLAATLRLVTSPELDHVTGRFFDGTRDARAHEQAYDPTARAELRRRTDALVATALAP